MKNLTLAALALAAFLTACGGGGGGTPSNNPASISGTSSGTTTKGSSNFVSGTLTINDSDVGQAVFKTPASLVGTYGTFTFNAATGAWTYLIDNTKPATTALTSAQTVNDALTVTSSDGTASLDIKITINGSGTGGVALVTSVPAPTYGSTDPYAAEKVAVFNRLNEDRARCGFGKVAQNTLLDKAAQAHANYLAINDLNSHSEVKTLTGFTGETVGVRQFNQGYLGSSAGEVIATQLFGTAFSNAYLPFSASEKSGIVNLKNLYSSIYHLRGLLNYSTEMGIGQILSQSSSTAWQKRLVINFATSDSVGSSGQTIPKDGLVSFPCNQTTNLSPIFSSENPDAFPNVNRDVTPYGQPVYLMASENSTLTLTSSLITQRGGNSIPVTVLTKDNDPAGILTSNQVFVVPTQRLADNSTYDVVVSGTNSGMMTTQNPTGIFTRSFSFSTGTFTSE